jgi:hypothetical protein
MNKALEFVKLGKEYKSTHGGNWFHIYFKCLKTGKSYRTALYKNMRNFKNWKEIIDKAERGDVIDNLKMKLYKGKEIVDADSIPKLYTMDEINEINNTILEDFYDINNY